MRLKWEKRALNRENRQLLSRFSEAEKSRRRSMISLISLPSPMSDEGDGDVFFPNETNLSMEQEEAHLEDMRKMMELVRDLRREFTELKDESYERGFMLVVTLMGFMIPVFFTQINLN